MQSHKSFRTKQKLAKAQKQNRPIPQWIRLRTGNTIRCVLMVPPLPSPARGSGHHPFRDRLCGPWAGMSVRMEADSGWPADTTPSEDIGARRESVFRSKGQGAWDVVQGKQMPTARWTKDMDYSGLLLQNFCWKSHSEQSSGLNLTSGKVIRDCWHNM